MLSDRIIVCVANDWNDDPTSKHHVMRLFSERNDILWVNHRGLRRPRINLADIRSAWKTIRSAAKGAHSTASRVTQLTPMIIPAATQGTLRRLNHRLLMAQIRSALRRIPGSVPRRLQIWSFAPDMPELIGSLDEECFVYYCTDDYARFEGLDGARIRDAENEMLKRADVVVATSEPLRLAKSYVRPDVHLVRHGVDYDHFASAWREAEALPEDIAQLCGPVFGFFGLVHHWIDIELLADVAARRPAYNFVLIGECKVEVAALRGRANVHLLGRRSYGDLPRYAAGFTAGLLPFRRTEMTRSINPVKMLEYLAAGLPIVSTPLPEAERFRGPIRFADNAESFAVACDEVVADRRQGSRQSISRVASNEGWASRVDLLSRIVASAVENRIGDGLKHEVPKGALACGVCGDAMSLMNSHGRDTYGLGGVGGPAFSRMTAELVPGSDMAPQSSRAPWPVAEGVDDANVTE